MEVFHNQCVTSVLGISRIQLWKDHLSTSSLLTRWGDMEYITEKVAKNTTGMVGLFGNYG